MNHLFKSLLFIFNLAIGLNCYSQNKQTEELPISLRNDLESLAASGENTEDNTEYQELLNEYAAHPLNLNTSSKEELELFPLLNSLQIIAILNHREKFGPFRCMEELQVIDAFSVEAIRKFYPYLTVGNVTAGVKANFKNLLAKADHSITIRFQKNLNIIKDDPEQNKYYGEPYKLFSRYKYKFGNRFRFSLTGEKDAGESLFKYPNSNGFDFTSGYLEITKKGLVQKIILGDYSIQFGQGLVLWSGFGFGKSSETVLIKKNPRGIIPYSSTDENRFMRGAAVHLAFNKFSSYFFFSQHKLDANSIPTDSETVISALQNTGYHRNQSELSDKHVQQEQIAGASFEYKTKNLILGLIGYHTQYSVPFEKQAELRSLYQFSKQENLNGGIHYNFIYRNLNVFGEFGMSESGGMAILQSCIAQLHPNFSTSLLFRKYDKKYQALKAHGFSENTITSNETGWYWGFNWKIKRGISLNCYADFFHFPWLKYQVDAPSSGNEFLYQITWLPKKAMEMYIRYRIQNKEENNSNETEMLHSLIPVKQENLRWNFRMDLNETWEWGSRVEYIQSTKNKNSYSKGFAVFQEIFFHPMKGIVSGSIRYGIFNCPEYDSRIFAYENDVLYSYSVPAAYGSGTRYYLNLRLRIYRGLNLWAKYSSTKILKAPLSQQADASPIPTSDLKLQVMYQF